MKSVTVLVYDHSCDTISAFSDRDKKTAWMFGVFGVKKLQKVLES